MELSQSQGFALRVCWGVAAVLMAVFALQVGTDLAGERVTDLLQDYLYNFLLFAGAGFCLWRAAAVRVERLPWLIMGLGIVAWTAADIVWTAAYADAANAPYPGIADALWLVYYPAGLATLLLLVRARLKRTHSSLWLDGMIGALATAALATRPRLDPARPRARAERRGGRHLPDSDRRGHLPGRFSARRALAGRHAARRPGGVAAADALPCLL